MLRITRRAALAATATFLTSPARAQPVWPAKAIRWVVPFPAGGPSDVFSRPLAQELGNLVGQPVIVENVSGAGGGIGSDRVAKAVPDGHTLGTATTGTHAINPSLYGRPGLDTSKDFTALTLAVRYANVLIVNSSVPVNSVRELIEYAKANPGKVTFGSSGNGASNHLSGELLRLVSGAPMTHVPYRGTAPALTDLMSGQITFMFDIPVSAMTAVQAGRAKVLAVTTQQRWPFVPDVPTMAEAGLQGFAAVGTDLWFGVVGPAGMPRPLANRINGALIQVLRSRAIRELASAQQFQLWTSTPEEFANEIRVGRERWATIVKAAGVKLT